MGNCGWGDVGERGLEEVEEGVIGEGEVERG